MFYTTQLDITKIKFELPIVKADYSLTPIKYNYGTNSEPNYQELQILLAPMNVKILGKAKQLLVSHQGNDVLEMIYNTCLSYVEQFDGAKLSSFTWKPNSGTYFPLKPNSKLYYLWPLPLRDLPIETYMKSGHLIDWQKYELWNVKIKPIVKIKSIYISQKHASLVKELAVAGVESFNVDNGFQHPHFMFLSIFDKPKPDARLFRMEKNVDPDKATISIETAMLGVGFKLGVGNK